MVRWVVAGNSVCVAFVDVLLHGTSLLSNYRIVNFQKENASLFLFFFFQFSKRTTHIHLTRMHLSSRSGTSRGWCWRCDGKIIFMDKPFTVQLQRAIGTILFDKSEVYSSRFRFAMKFSVEFHDFMITKMVHTAHTHSTARRTDSAAKYALTNANRFVVVAHLREKITETPESHKHRCERESCVFLRYVLQHINCSLCASVLDIASQNQARGDNFYICVSSLGVCDFVCIVRNGIATRKLRKKALRHLVRLLRLRLP